MATAFVAFCVGPLGNYEQVFYLKELSAKTKRPTDTVAMSAL
jgi:hypothetical protein